MWYRQMPWNVISVDISSIKVESKQDHIYSTLIVIMLDGVLHPILAGCVIERRELGVP